MTGAALTQCAFNLFSRQLRRRNDWPCVETHTRLGEMPSFPRPTRGLTWAVAPRYPRQIGDRFKMTDNITHLFGPEKESVSVLLVDDQEMFRDLARSVLETGEDYRVIGEAGGGIEAVRMTRELRPDLVVMDIQMPDMGGIEATREIVTSVPGTQIVLMSMGSDSEYPALVRAIGANGFLTKRNVTPRNLDELLGRSDMPDTLAA